MVVYGDGSSTAAERAFRYLEVRDTNLLPTLLVGDHALSARMGTYHLSCKRECKTVDDRWGFIRATLRLRSHPYHVYIARRNGTVIFSDDIADTSDIQQLTEKYLDGVVHYADDETHATQSLIGGEVSSFPAIRVSDGRLVTIPQDLPDGHNFLLFTARCPDCSLDGLVHVSNILKASRLTSKTSGVIPQTVLFSSRFSSRELKQLVLASGSPADVYQATGSIPALEDLANLTLSAPADICLVRTGASGTIIGITSFRLSGGSLQVVQGESYGLQ